MSDDAALKRELTPTGALRVGIATSPAPSAFFALLDPTTGRPRGVTISIGTAMAQELGVPMQPVIFPNSGELTEAAASGAWDVAFMPVDDERKQKVDFGPAYYLFESTFMVRPGAPIQSIAEVDRPGVRVLGIANTTTIRSAGRVLKQATLTPVRTVDELIAKLRAGEADAVALSLESLHSLAPQVPGARILAGHFHASAVAVAVPKQRPAALAFVTQFLEEAKASGLVRRALDDAGMKDAAVAPPAAR